MKGVFDCLRKYNLYIKFLKCRFSVQEVDFLRYIVEINSVSININRIIIIIKWPVFNLYRDI